MLFIHLICPMISSFRIEINWFDIITNLLILWCSINSLLCVYSHNASVFFFFNGNANNYSIYIMHQLSIFTQVLIQTFDCHKNWIEFPLNANEGRRGKRNGKIPCRKNVYRASMLSSQERRKAFVFRQSTRHTHTQIFEVTLRIQMRKRQKN